MFGCYNKMPEARKLINHRNLLLINSGGLEIQDQGIANSEFNEFSSWFIDRTLLCARVYQDLSRVFFFLDINPS